MLDVAKPSAPGAHLTDPPSAPPSARRRLDRFDWGVLAVFGAISLWVVGVDLWQVVADGRTWTGTDGVYIVDQMQYLAWIRDASHHLLGSNLFTLRPSSADYLLPPIAISGGITALGVAPAISYLLWKPVAVIAFFAAARAFARRGLADTTARRAALVLALFSGSFTVLYGSVGVIGDLTPAFLSWGYPFALLGVASMVAALLLYEHGRSGERIAWAAPLLGALASWLHPWQGETLILVIGGSELLLWRSRARVAQLAIPALTIAATAAPLAYYSVLGRTDSSWTYARQASHHVFPLSPLLVGLVPLLVPAMIAAARRPRGFHDLATRIWPLASVTIFVLSGTALSATPLHAFDGITVPLSVLAVDGVRRIGLGRLPRARLLAALASAVLTVPATLWLLDTARKLARPGAGNPNFIHGSERRALAWLAADRRRGGVLTRFYLGTIVPELTGRHAYVGHCLWSEPGCMVRAARAQQLLRGEISPDRALAFVSSTGARFVLTDCRANADLTVSLRPILVAVRDFGCSTVYEVRPGQADY